MASHYEHLTALQKLVVGIIRLDSSCRSGMDIADQLGQESFQSVLDEPLIVAIASDYNLQITSEYDSVHRILHSLAHHSQTGEATSSMVCRVVNEDSNEGCNDLQKSIKRLSEISLASERDEDKLRMLFPDLKEFDVVYALRKSDGDFQLALDDLLNIQYLQSTGQRVKGINGFFCVDDAVDFRKKRKARTTQDQGAFFSFPEIKSPVSTDDFSDQQAVTYIAKRLHVPTDEVYPVYYEKNCSINATVVEILNQHAARNASHELDKEATVIQRSLTLKYQHLPGLYFHLIAHATTPSVEYAHDIAKLANEYFSNQHKRKKFELSYRLTPLPHEEIEGLHTIKAGTNSKRPNFGINKSAACAGSPSSPPNMLNQEEHTKLSKIFNQQRRDAATTAASLNAKGASNQLYRQAAGYYSNRAREKALHAQKAASAAADLLVREQSSSHIIDLHGVSVHDGRRIALEKAMDWWNSDEHTRGSRSQENELTIITGLGRHSAGGVSQLRKAVVTALLQDGWKLRVETGRFVITGR